MSFLRGSQNQPLDDPQAISACTEATCVPDAIPFGGSWASMGVFKAHITWPQCTGRSLAHHSRAREATILSRLVCIFQGTQRSAGNRSRSSLYASSDTSRILCTHRATTLDRSHLDENKAGGLARKAYCKTCPSLILLRGVCLRLRRYPRGLLFARILLFRKASWMVLCHLFFRVYCSRYLRTPPPPCRSTSGIHAAA